LPSEDDSDAYTIESKNTSVICERLRRSESRRGWPENLHIVFDACQTTRSSLATHCFVISMISGRNCGALERGPVGTDHISNRPFRSTHSQTADKSAAPKPDPKLGIDEFPRD